MPAIIATNHYLCRACGEARGKGELLLHRDNEECASAVYRASPRGSAEALAFSLERETFECSHCGLTKPGAVQGRDTDMRPLCADCVRAKGIPDVARLGPDVGVLAGPVPAEVGA